jgi:hypothetical protein
MGRRQAASSHLRMTMGDMIAIGLKQSRTKFLLDSPESLKNVYRTQFQRISKTFKKMVAQLEINRSVRI